MDSLFLDLIEIVESTRLRLPQHLIEEPLQEEETLGPPPDLVEEHPCHEFSRKRSQDEEIPRVSQNLVRDFLPDEEIPRICPDVVDKPRLIPDLSGQPSQLDEIELPHLPQDIIEDILSRLLGKPLLRFRCVSTLWSSLISSKRFINSHLKKSLKNSNFTDEAIIATYMKAKYKDQRKFSVINPLNELISDDGEIFPVTEGWYDFVGCSNGLHCFIIRRAHFALWNPCTRISNKLPILDPNNNPDDYLIESFGFGYDELGDDYKVFVVMRDYMVDGREFDYLAKVYSLKANSWKIINTFQDCGLVDDEGKLVEGKLHWDVNLDRCPTWKIVYFDLSTETSGVVEHPRGLDEVLDPVIDVLKGCLCVRGYCQDKCCIDVWILKEYGVKNSWYKACRVPFDQGPHNNPWSSCSMSVMRDLEMKPQPTPMCITQDLEILCYDNSTFRFYNPTTKTYRHPKMNHVKGADVCLQSLVSPFYDGEHEEKNYFV